MKELKPNTLYSSKVNDELYFFKTDGNGIPINLVTGKVNHPLYPKYRELDNNKSARLLAWSMKDKGRLMIAYGKALEKLVGRIDDPDAP